MILLELHFWSSNNTNINLTLSRPNSQNLLSSESTGVSTTPHEDAPVINALPKTQLITVQHQQRRSVFISRLAASTSGENIVCFIKENCSEALNCDKIKCHKFNTATPRDISSFKIIPPPHLLNQLLLQ